MFDLKVVISTLLAIVLSAGIAANLSFASNAEKPNNSSAINSREELLSYINTDHGGEPLYRSWSMFPSNTNKTHSNQPISHAGNQYQSEYFLKRLGLPVHGRWISTYVNPIAHDYLITAIRAPLDDEPLEMPIGSIIVKENFRTEESFKAFDNQSLANGGASPRPAVLTILLKVGTEFCQSNYKFNGSECFGGSWMWVFSGVNPKSKSLDSEIDPRSFCMNCHAPAINSDYLRSLQSQRRMFTGTQNQLTRKVASPAPANDVCEGNLSLSSDLPNDVPRDPLSVSNAQKMFDCVSWKSFVALNWPASLQDRGQPDVKISNAADPNFMKGPRVWQTYKETYEVFQPTITDWNPSNQAWNAKQPKPVGEGCDADLPLISMVSKTQSSSAISVANETGQAFAGSFGTLVDQNSNLVRYAVSFNRDEFEYIIDTKSAITKNLTPAGPKKANLPDNMSGKYGGAIEVKAAWREMCTSAWEKKHAKSCFPSVDDQSQYFTQQVLVYSAKSDRQPARCETKTMGLIALHIAHKTHWAPQWIWSTFSFKNNVPNANDPHAQATPFFDPARVPRAEDNCWSAPFLISPDTCPNVELNRKKMSAEGTWQISDKPNQITRLQPIAGSGLNQTFSKLLAGTPFENYVLLNTQWPLNGRTAKGQMNQFNCKQNTLGSNCFTMVPRYLRNPVVESYMTTYNYQRQQYSNRSCMGCHTSAGADASYIWLDAVEQVVPLEK
ncbi:MAG: hypothetical protein JKX81_14880 [Arenicella sp.]|nr:hypothetical protein [Arenicella sp.]